jgi:excisionase family DNA binding protein
MNQDATQIKPATERAFISLPEAAQQIGCTRRFLESRIADGEIKVFRPSTRLVRIARPELARWVESYSHGGVATATQEGVL